MVTGTLPVIELHEVRVESNRMLMSSHVMLMANREKLRGGERAGGDWHKGPHTLVGPTCIAGAVVMRLSTTDRSTVMIHDFYRAFNKSQHVQTMQEKHWTVNVKKKLHILN